MTTNAIEVRETLRKLDLEVACALNMPWAEELLMAELDRVENRRAWESTFDAVGNLLGMGFFDHIGPPYRGPRG